LRRLKRLTPRIRAFATIEEAVPEGESRG